MAEVSEGLIGLEVSCLCGVSAGVCRVLSPWAPELAPVFGSAASLSRPRLPG